MILYTKSALLATNQASTTTQQIDKILPLELFETFLFGFQVSKNDSDLWPLLYFGLKQKLFSQKLCIKQSQKLFDGNFG